MRDYQQRVKQEPYFWDVTIEQATGRAFDWCCPFCGCSIENELYCRAHIEPVGSGVGLIPGNVVLSCFKCNLSMGNRRAWDWCSENGIKYWWMIPILETLAKVFVKGVETAPPKPKITINPSRVVSKQSARKRLMEHLELYPQDWNLSVRDLAARTAVGKSTVQRVFSDRKQ